MRKGSRLAIADSRFTSRLLLVCCLHFTGMAKVASVVGMYILHASLLYNKRLFYSSSCHVIPKVSAAQRGIPAASIGEDAAAACSCSSTSVAPQSIRQQTCRVPPAAASPVLRFQGAVSGRARLACRHRRHRRHQTSRTMLPKHFLGLLEPKARSLGLSHP